MQRNFERRLCTENSVYFLAKKYVDSVKVEGVTEELSAAYKKEMENDERLKSKIEEIESKGEKFLKKGQTTEYKFAHNYSKGKWHTGYLTFCWKYY